MPPTPRCRPRCAISPSASLPVYQEDDPDRYLSNLAALQMAVGDPAAAHATRLTLQERLQSEQSTLPAGRAVVYDIYTQARAIEATESIPFASAYGQAFRETLNRHRRSRRLRARRLVHHADRAAARDPPARARRAARQRAPSRSRKRSSSCGRGSRSRPIAASASVARPLARRRQGKALRHRRGRDPRCERTRRSRRRWSARARATDAGTLPTLLEFTLDRSSRDAREAAAHGYASVLALARIAGDPKFRPRAPFESDGDDARAVIEWIAKQSWSDGRVGMQGNGYGGFVAWSAAKRLPAALKAIATSDPMAPGIDVPSPNGIFLNSAYRWVYEHSGAARRRAGERRCSLARHRRRLVPIGPPLSRVSDAAGPAPARFFAAG